MVSTLPEVSILTYRWLAASLGQLDRTDEAHARYGDGNRNFPVIV